MRRRTFNNIPEAIFASALLGTVLCTLAALFSPEPMRFGMAAIAFGLVLNAYKPV